MKNLDSSHDEHKILDRDRLAEMTNEQFARL